jgi:hypothetical protein
MTPVQSAVLSSRVTHYKPIAPVDQSYLSFVIPSDSEAYIDINILMSVRGKLVAHDNSPLDVTDSTTAVQQSPPFAVQSVQCHSQRSLSPLLQGSLQI